MRSESRAAFLAAIASVVLAGLMALFAGLGLAGGAAAEVRPAADASTGSPSDSASAMSSVSTSASASTSASPSASPSLDAAFTVDDASLRWGINDESNNRAFAPGTYNFFSAGKIEDPGQGGQALSNADSGATWANGKPAGWKQQAGNVSIEKYAKTGDATYAYVPATWTGLKTDRTGTAIPGPTSGKFSEHQVVLVGGTGTVDPATGTAQIRWTGDFTVIYYSGYSFFYVSDPVLTVTDGNAVLTAMLSGYNSSMDDLSQWGGVSPKQVTLANLGHVDLAAALGFNATPAYAGVQVTVPVTGTQQAAKTADNAAYWGSFPQSFIDYQTTAGTGSYWYTSGGSNDRFKTALPLTVSYDAGAPVAVPVPSATTQVDTISNPVKTRPASTSTPSATASTTTADSAVGGSVVAAPPAAAPPATGTAAQSWPNARPVDTVLALASSPTRDNAPPTWPWWAGSIALVAAGATTAVAFAPPRLRRLLGAAGRRSS